MKSIYGVFIASLIMIFNGCFLNADSNDVIPLTSLGPTKKIEQNPTKMEIEAICEIDFNKSEDFMVSPNNLVVDQKDNVFVYDNRLLKIFIFNKNHEYVKSFGKIGGGPGELMGAVGRLMQLNVGPNNNLYLIDNSAHRIHVYDEVGVSVRDYRYMERESWMANRSIPIDESGKMYFLMDHKEKPLTLLVTYIDPTLKGMINIAPRKGEVVREIQIQEAELGSRSGALKGAPLSLDLIFERLANGTFLILNPTTSILYVFNKTGSIKKYWMMPEGLPNINDSKQSEYKKIVKKAKSPSKKGQKIILKVTPELWHFMVVDNTDPDHFYLQVTISKLKYKRLYCFQLPMKLLSVYEPVVVEGFPLSLYKKKGMRFYSIRKGKIYITKEVKQ